jgi:hypothetical protein
LRRIQDFQSFRQRQEYGISALDLRVPGSQFLPKEFDLVLQARYDSVRILFGRSVL